MNPNKLALCSSCCLDKPVMPLFSFRLFLLSSLCLPLSPSHPSHASSSSLLLRIRTGFPAADLRPGTCLLCGGSSPSAYSMRRPILAIGRWPLRQLQLNRPWCAPLFCRCWTNWRLRLVPPFLAVVYSTVHGRTILTRLADLTAVYCRAGKGSSRGLDRDDGGSLELGHRRLTAQVEVHDNMHF